MTYLLTPLVTTIFAVVIFAVPGYVLAQEKPAQSSGGEQVVKAVGTIKTIQVDLITVAAESGGEVTAKLTGSTKILRVPPGEKDLRNATALQPQDLQPGDRVLVRGHASADGHTIAALAIIVMKEADVAAKKQQDLADWQKRGVDGLVTNVDAAAGIITISSGGMGAKRSVAVHVTKDTILRTGLGKFRRCEAGAPRSSRAGRSVPSARDAQLRWHRTDGGRGCLRHIP